MSPEEKVTIGFVSRVRGVGGEVMVSPLTDNLKRFGQLGKVFILLAEKYHAYDVERSSIIGDRVSIKLSGVNAPEDARSLVGCYLEVEKKEVPPLPKGQYYVFDIVGLKVKNIQGEDLGVIKEVIRYPANDVYVISHMEKELDLPATKEIIKTIDLKNKVMVIQPLPGLWDQKNR